MKVEELIELGTKLGLPFRRDSNFEKALAQDRVVFNGANAQRFLIEGRWTDAEIYDKLGQALKDMGNMEHRMELNRLFQIF